MQNTHMQNTMVKRLSAGLALALVFTLPGQISHAQTGASCDANGNKVDFGSVNRVCFVRGLRNQYTVFGPPLLYNPSGTLITGFNGQTVENPSWQYSCGPADTPNVIAYATDGSGRYIKIGGYSNWGRTIYNSDGTVWDTFDQTCP